jgi:uncharacterized protein (TIRG00374 family)
MDEKTAQPLIPGILAFVRRYFFLFFVVLLVVVALATGVDLRKGAEALGRYRLWQVAAFAAVCLLICANFILKNSFLIRLAGHPVPLGRMAMYFFSSAVAHYTVPGKIGYPVTAWLLKKFEKIPLSSSSSVLMADFLISFAFTATLAVAGSLLFFRSYRLAVVLAAGLALAAAAVSFLVLGNVLKRVKKKTRLTEFLSRMLDNLKTYGPRKLWPLLVFYAVNALLNGFALWLLVAFAGVNVGLERLVTADAVSFVLGSVSMVPMGLGVQDISMLFFLSSFGLDRPASLAVVFIQRTVYLGLVYLLGLAVNIALGVKDLKGEPHA